MVQYLLYFMLFLLAGCSFVSKTNKNVNIQKNINNGSIHTFVTWENAPGWWIDLDAFK